MKKLIKTLFVFLLLIPIIEGCKRDTIVNHDEFSELRAFYDKHKPDPGDLFEATKPEWHNINLIKQDSLWVYEIALENPDKVGIISKPLTTKDLKDYEQAHALKLLLFVQPNTQKVTEGCYMGIESSNDTDLGTVHYRQTNGLTGQVIYYHLNGAMSNGIAYINGKPMYRIQELPAKDLLSLKKNGKSVLAANGNASVQACYTFYNETGFVGCAGVDGYEVCKWYPTGTNAFKLCPGGIGGGNPLENDHYQGGGGGGSGTKKVGVGEPIIERKDCAGVPGGTAYNADCGCIGGTTGKVACPSVADIKKDSLAKYYPCMVKEVLDKLLQNDAYSKLIQPFQNIRLPNGSLLQISGLPNLTFNFSSQPYSNAGYMLGNTVGSGYSSKIEFNSLAMNNASQLFLQMAAIHEVAHAYTNFYLKAGAYGFPIDTTKYSTWAMNIVNFESVAKSEITGGNFNDHSLFIENYVDKFIGILKEINGITYTDKQYQMAAIYGLNNPGERTYDYFGIGFDLYAVYKNKLEKSYSNLLTKFGISEAERDAFYLKNLVTVPINKKLSKGCIGGILKSKLIINGKNGFLAVLIRNYIKRQLLKIGIYTTFDLH